MRGYGQYCGIARSLEIIGDRWNLLIVRELLIAPSRYRDLAQGLPGIATNMLADRLRDLEAAGIVERRLAGEGSVVEYALTPWGAELRRPLESLMRWSVPLMVSGPAQGDTFRPEWLQLAVPALLDGRLKGRSSATIGLDIGEPGLQLAVTRSGVTVGPADGAELDATIRTEPTYVLALASGALTLDEARALGVVDVDGDDAAVRRAFAA